MSFNNSSTRFASAAVFIAASVWGLYWVPLRYLEDLGVDGAWAVTLLNLPAAAPARCRRSVAMEQGIVTRSAKRLSSARLTGIGLALYASGLVFSSVVRATLLFYLTPVWATLIGMFWLGEQASWQRWAAIVGGLGGLMLLVSGGGFGTFEYRRPLALSFRAFSGRSARR